MKRKIKWLNVLKVVMLMVCISLILKDTYVLITSFASFTLYGFISHVLAWSVSWVIYEDLEGQID